MAVPPVFRHDVDAVLVAEREGRRHVVGALDPHNGGGGREVVDAEDVLELAVAVEAVLVERLLVGVDLAGTEASRTEPIDDRFTGEGHGWGFPGDCRRAMSQRTR